MASGGGAYWLAYSGASWQTGGYAMGFARCDGPLGPCRDMSTGGPWIASSGDAAGPGGSSFFAGPDLRMRIAYHAWSGGVGYGHGGQRALHVEPIDVDGSGPSLADAPPVGAIEALTRTPGGVQVSGWALDPDTSRPTSVGVFIDGQLYAGGAANADRPDVASLHPFAGPDHGFGFSIDPADGSHHICVTASNDIGGGTGLIACDDLTVSSMPFGGLDSATASSATAVQVAGWAIDPSTAAPIDADLYVDGSYAGRSPAAATRPDVGAAWPAYGSVHGFTASVPLPTTGGPHTVCAYAAVDDGLPAPRLGCTNV
jgi:hypothetical protein